MMYSLHAFKVLGATFFVVALHSGIFAIEIDNTELIGAPIGANGTTTRLHELDRLGEVMINMGQIQEI